MERFPEVSFKDSNSVRVCAAMRASSASRSLSTGRASKRRKSARATEEATRSSSRQKLVRSETPDRTSRRGAVETKGLNDFRYRKIDTGRAQSVGAPGQCGNSDHPDQHHSHAFTPGHVALHNDGAGG